MSARDSELIDMRSFYERQRPAFFSAMVLLYAVSMVVTFADRNNLESFTAWRLDYSRRVHSVDAGRGAADRLGKASFTPVDGRQPYLAVRNLVFYYVLCYAHLDASIDSANKRLTGRCRHVVKSS